jgi:hypothetical protein
VSRVRVALVGNLPPRDDCFLVDLHQIDSSKLGLAAPETLGQPVPMCA